MVFRPRISFKTGINPSILSSFPLNGNYTGTQKLLLARTRIFGTKIGYLPPNCRCTTGSGVHPFRKVFYGRNLLRPYNLMLRDFDRYFPWIQDHYEGEFHRTKKAMKAEQVRGL